MQDIEEIDTLQQLKTAVLGGGVALRGRALIVDFYTPSRLEVRVTQESGNVNVAVNVLSGSKSWALSKADFLHAGTRSWVVFGLLVRLFEDEFPHRALTYLAGMADRTLTSDEARQLLKRCEDWEIPVVGGVSEVAPPEAIPILLLTDRYGAFVNLSDPRSEPDLLEVGYVKKPMDSSMYYCPTDRVREALVLLLQVGWHVVDSTGRQVELLTCRKLTAELDGDVVVLRGHLTSSHGESEVPLSAVARREPFLPLGQGRVGLLEDERPLRMALEAGEIVGDTLRVRRTRAGALVASNLPVEGGTDWKALMENLTDPREALPGGGFKGVLRRYQQQGVNWIAFLHRNRLAGMLADDMGLGKTVQVLAWLSQADLRGPALIVVPRSLLFHWQNEAARFLPAMSVVVHHGVERGTLPASGLVITSFGTLLRDSAVFEEIRWSAIIIDEAQRIKNASSQTSQAVCRLKADFRLSMSGTPVENHLGELWAQFRFLLPDLFGSDAEFGVLDIEQIRLRVRPYLLRRTKLKVAKDLPPRIEQDAWVQMTPNQEAVYERLLDQFRKGVLRKVVIDGLSAHRMEVFEAILRLRQICCHPFLIGEEGASGKVQALLGDIETIVEEGAQVILYSQFTSFLKLIGKEMTSSYLYLDGQTADREEVVGRFQKREVPVLLASLKVGGVGLNLTAADYVLLAEPWWNEAVEQQAIDRAHRIGRESPVIARRYLTANTIEVRVRELQQSKSALIDSLLDGAATEAHALTEHDIQHLLS